MRKHLLGLVLIAGLGACTSDERSGSPAGGDSVDAMSSVAPMPTPASLAAARGSVQHFASLPDRGELLSYGGIRKARQSGAYTYHPVSISEAHALNAIGNGRLVVNTPDGEAVALRYERHEEQADGNWTWIGRNDDGTSAVLTFGEKAVFGTFAHDGANYRVRTDRTGAWVVATDPHRVAANGGRPADGNDTLMPPESHALAAAASRQLAKNAGARQQAVAGKATAVVDVLIGHSSTIATELGSQNAAITLMSNLVGVANASYANSGVNMRLRLVHVMPVDYGDNTDNSAALQQLTGYNAETQQTMAPNAAFNALRAARDEHGADLVAFVRRYREPEQDGCGIAWLLGMNQSGISAADEAFGYAVISDGEDLEEGDGHTYFCSPYSLAHELGHLMGQAHDRSNAQDGGAHTYSHGYRETSTTGFFTIMAYPSGDAQVEAPYFANPAVNWQGRPTGTATEDNVRSMNQTMPIIAQFRATVVPLGNVRGDFDGDGKSDVLFRHTGSGQNVIWKSANGATQQAMTAVPNLSWKVAGTGDFNGDGKADVLWRNTSSGANVIWKSASSAAADAQAVATVADRNWNVAGVGDFNGDGRSDILWRHSGGRNVIWLSGSSTTQAAVATVGGGGWSVAGIGDFDGDGRDDILWRSATNGQNTIWKSGSSTTPQAVTTVADQNWKVAGIGDFNGDGRADILWRHAVSGRNVIWRGGNSATEQAVTTVPKVWLVAAVADYDGDGSADILWRSSANGGNVYWKGGNFATQQAVAAVPNLSWRVFY